MAVLDIPMACSLAYRAGFTGAQADTIVAIAAAESGLDSTALSPPNTDGSRDRGILQINSSAWASIPDSCCYDPACAFGAAWTISSRGTNFRPWTTYTSGAYRDHYTAGMCGGATSGGGGLGTGTGQAPTGVVATEHAMVPAMTAMISDYGTPRSDTSSGIHEGRDLAAPEGSAILAPEDGTVANNYVDGLGGNALVIAGRSGLYWYFAHMLNLSPFPTGSSVLAGLQVGQVSNTGDSLAQGSPPHLHYQVGPGGRWGDPKIILANFTPTVPAGGGGASWTDGGNVGALPGVVLTIGQQLHQTLIQTPGFGGIVLAIDEAETFPGIVVYHPSSVADMPGEFLRSAMGTISGNALAFFVRGLTVGCGLLLLAGLLWNAGGKQVAMPLFEAMA